MVAQPSRRGRPHGKRKRNRQPRAGNRAAVPPFTIISTRRPCATSSSPGSDPAPTLYSRGITPPTSPSLSPPRAIGSIIVTSRTPCPSITCSSGEGCTTKISSSCWRTTSRATCATRSGGQSIPAASAGGTSWRTPSSITPAQT